MNGLYFYKLVSPYQEDITKNCKLTINEIDHNFLTLKDADVSSAKYDVESHSIILSKKNGDTIVVDMTHAFDHIEEELLTTAKNLQVDFDYETGNLTISYNDVVKEIKGIVTYEDEPDEPRRALTHVLTDGTLSGKGNMSSPLSLGKQEQTGVYKPVKRILESDEDIPEKDKRVKGDRYVVKDYVSDYGLLYNMDSVKKIDEFLENGWRVPTKEDWDGVLNAIEPCDDDKNHTSETVNEVLGKYAGKELKSAKNWNESGDDTIIGIDSYNMALLPSGLFGRSEWMFGESGFYWSSTFLPQGDIYVKEFSYDTNGVIQRAENEDVFLSLRLVKDYNGHNHKEEEFINDAVYSTVLLPSETAEKGSSIWTSRNISFRNEGLEYKEPNGGEGLGERVVYYIIDWTGSEWARKELKEGEQVVVLEDGDKKNTEYMLVDGELVAVYEKVFEELSAITSALTEKVDELSAKTDVLIEDVDTLKTEVSELEERVDEFISSATTEHERLESLIVAEENRAISAETALDTKIEEEIARAKESENAINDKIVVSGTYDNPSGKLTLETVDGTEIVIDINSNYGTF